MSDHHQRVKAYYEQNTRKFLKWGQHGEVKSMHQPLWAEGVENIEQAIHYVHHLIEEELGKLESMDGNILDLGCGVGSSLFYLGERNEGEMHGITISPTQVEIARQTLENRSTKAKLHFHEGDMLEVPEDISSLKLSYAIESFVHQNDPIKFFQTLGERTYKGGLLCICDDFLGDHSDSSGASDKIQAFKDGWMIGTLVSIKEVEAIAGKSGWKLVANTDLTPYMRINRPRDRFLDLVLPFMPYLGFNAHYIRSLKGGRAKQNCIKNGWIKYRFLVFERK